MSPFRYKGLQDEKKKEKEAPQTGCSGQCTPSRFKFQFKSKMSFKDSKLKLKIEDPPQTGCSGQCTPSRFKFQFQFKS